MSDIRRIEGLYYKTKNTTIMHGKKTPVLYFVISRRVGGVGSFHEI